MTFYVFLLIGLFFALLYLILTQPAQKSAAVLMNAGPFALIVLGVLLTFTRRGACLLYTSDAADDAMTVWSSGGAGS